MLWDRKEMTEMNSTNNITRPPPLLGAGEKDLPAPALRGGRRLARCVCAKNRAPAPSHRRLARRLSPYVSRSIP